jgi:hypothetical protein
VTQRGFGRNVDAISAIFGMISRPTRFLGRDFGHIWRVFAPKERALGGWRGSGSGDADDR